MAAMLTLSPLKARLSGASLATVQIRPRHSDDNKALGRWQKTPWIDLIVVAPGWRFGARRRAR